MRPRHAELVFCGLIIGLAAYLAYIILGLFFHA
jgi:hypothetical protein